MKPHEPQDIPPRPWYKKLWFLALINGFGAVVGFFYLHIVNINDLAQTIDPGSTPPVSTPLLIALSTITGLIIAPILAYTIWHDEKHPPRTFIRNFIGVWFLIFIVSSYSIFIGFVIALFGALLILGALETWKRIGGCLSGVIAGFATAFALSFIGSTAGIDSLTWVTALLLVFLGGGIFGLIFGDTLHRDNEKLRRLNPEDYINQPKPIQDDLLNLKNNLTVGDDGELVEIDETPSHSEEKQNS